MFAKTSVLDGAMATQRAVRLAVLAVAVLLTATPTRAQETTTVGELSALNSANIIKAAQVAGAELDAKLSKSGAVESVSSPTKVDSKSSSPERVIEDDPAPVLKGVFGANGVLVATFLYAGGGTAMGREGQSIPGGYTVSHLGAEQVTLRDKKGRTFDVPFSDRAPIRRDPAPAQQVPFNGFPMGAPPMGANMPVPA